MHNAYQSSADCSVHFVAVPGQKLKVKMIDQLWEAEIVPRRDRRGTRCDGSAALRAEIDGCDNAVAVGVDHFQPDSGVAQKFGL